MEIPQAFDVGRALTHGFEGLKRQPVGLLIGSVLLTITSGQGSGPSDSGEGLDALQRIGEELGPVAIVVALLAAGCILVVIVLAWLFRSWLHPGYLRLHQDLVVQGTATLEPLFSGSDAFMRTALWKLMATGITVGTLVVAALPGAAIAGIGGLMGMEFLMYIGAGVATLVVLPCCIYVQLGLALGTHAVVLEGLEPGEGLERSWALADGHRLHLLLFFIVTGIVGFLGILACCVGIFATRAAVDVGTTEAFLLATRDDHETFALLQEVHVDT